MVPMRAKLGVFALHEPPPSERGLQSAGDFSLMKPAGRLPYVIAGVKDLQLAVSAEYVQEIVFLLDAEALLAGHG